MGDYDTTIRHLADWRPADFAWLALSPLVRGGTEEGVLRRAVEAVRRAPMGREERAGALTAMAVFGTVHGTREMIYSLVRREEMKESLVYQDILAEGQAEGLAKGRSEARSADVLRVLRRRFGTLPEAVQARVAGTRDPEALDRLLDLALDATSAEDFLAKA